MPMSTNCQKKMRKKWQLVKYYVIIGYDIYDSFTVEHFPLRQSMILTTIFFLLATVHIIIPQCAVYLLFKEIRKTVELQRDQKGPFELAVLIFTFKWYNWSNFRLLTTSHWQLTVQIVSLYRWFLYIHNLQFCRCWFHVKYLSKDVSGCSIANSCIIKCS
jgi:hypothetical protein